MTETICPACVLDSPQLRLCYTHRYRTLDLIETRLTQLEHDKETLQKANSELVLARQSREADYIELQREYALERMTLVTRIEELERQVTKLLEV